MLASQVTIGATDIGAFTRTVDATVATYQATDDVVQIRAQAIIDDLNSGLNVVVTTESDATGSGDLLITSNIVKSDARDVTLSLLATASIDVSGVSISASGGTLSVVMNSDVDNSDGGYVVIGGSDVITGGGDLTIGGGSDPVATPAIGTPINPQGVRLEATSTLDSDGGGYLHSWSRIQRGHGQRCGWSSNRLKQCVFHERVDHCHWNGWEYIRRQ